MASLNETFENMKRAGEAMKKASELFSVPVFVPLEKTNKWKSINDVREMMGMDKLYGDDELLGYVKADVEATMDFNERVRKEYNNGEPGMADPRYNEPKSAPKADSELVEETIVSTEIYRRARLAVLQDKTLNPEARNVILQAQARQVAYGIDKYPEPLNPNTWSIFETVEHIMDESIDKLHYLIMLRIKLEQSLVSGWYNDIVEVRNATSRIATISRMIDNAIGEMAYLVNLSVLVDRETESATNDSIDAMTYGVHFAKSECLNQFAGADLDGDTLRVFSDDELEALSAKRDE